MEIPVIDLANCSDSGITDGEIIEILTSSPPRPPTSRPSTLVAQAPRPPSLPESPLKSPPQSPRPVEPYRKRTALESDILSSSPLFDHERRPVIDQRPPMELSPSRKRYKSMSNGSNETNRRSVDALSPAVSDTSDSNNSLPPTKSPTAPEPSAKFDTHVPAIATETIPIFEESEDLFVSSITSPVPSAETSASILPVATIPAATPAATPTASSNIVPNTASTMTSTTTSTYSSTSLESTGPVLTAARTSTLDDAAPLKTSNKRRGAKKTSSTGPGSSSKVAAATKVSDRKTACEKLLCELWIDRGSWEQKISEEFANLDVNVKCETLSGQFDQCPDGVSLVLTASGNFDDAWDDELEVFVKCNPRRELMCTAIVALEASFMDVLGRMSLSKRSEYFASINSFVVEECGARADVAVLYIIPEVGAHFKKQAAKFNREMRRRIASSATPHDLPTTGSDSPPPDEHFYTNLETELQVMHGIRAYYPRKSQDAAEMIANCVVDMGYSRYHTLLDETHDAAGAYVRSKSNTLDITIESLTKIQGLPPRIAAKLGSESKSLGRILDLLGSNKDMRQSRIKRFGQGSWNAALLSVLEDEDPKRII